MNIYRCACCEQEYDAPDWSLQDDSFDHEFGTEVSQYMGTPCCGDVFQERDEDIADEDYEDFGPDDSHNYGWEDMEAPSVSDWRSEP